MRGIDQLGYRDSTLVFFTADNKPGGTGSRGDLAVAPVACVAANAIHTKVEFACPASSVGLGRLRRTVSNTPVIGSDVFTTVCTIVGAPLPTNHAINGASILPVFSGQVIERKQPLYWRNHLAAEQYRVALRNGDWKIIGSDDLNDFELYNLREDWQETKSLADKYPEKFEEMKAKLIQHDAAVLAEGPDWWKDEKETSEKKKSQPKNPKGNAKKRANAAKAASE